MKAGFNFEAIMNKACPTSLSADSIDPDSNMNFNLSPIVFLTFTSSIVLSVNPILKFLINNYFIVLPMFFIFVIKLSSILNVENCDFIL